jgi:hypothetical protein
LEGFVAQLACINLSWATPELAHSLLADEQSLLWTIWFSLPMTVVAEATTKRIERVREVTRILCIGKGLLKL